MYKLSYLGQFAAQDIETWQANCSTGNTPTATKIFVAMQLILFQSIDNVKVFRNLRGTVIFWSLNKSNFKRTTGVNREIRMRKCYALWAKMYLMEHMS